MYNIEIAQLQRTPIFQGVSAAVIHRFLEMTSHAIRSYTKGEFIAMQGDECNRIHLLYKGKVEAQMIGEDGKKLIVEELEASCILAPAFLFATQNHFPVTIETKTEETIVLVINRGRFVRLMQSEPQIMQNFIRIISDRSILLADKVNAFALQSMRVRLANYLYHHQQPATLQYIAEYLGVARPSLSRVVAQLVNEGYLKQENRKLIVPDREKLKAIV
jgi:CRP-like cAMP-binding protein